MRSNSHPRALIRLTICPGLPRSLSFCLLILYPIWFISSWIFQQTIRTFIQTQQEELGGLRFPPLSVSSGHRWAVCSERSALCKTSSPVTTEKRADVAPQPPCAQNSQPPTQLPCCCCQTSQIHRVKTVSLNYRGFVMQLRLVPTPSSPVSSCQWALLSAACHQPSFRHVWDFKITGTKWCTADMTQLLTSKQKLEANWNVLPKKDCHPGNKASTTWLSSTCTPRPRVQQANRKFLTLEACNELQLLKT